MSGSSTATLPALLPLLELLLLLLLLLSLPPPHAADAKRSDPGDEHTDRPPFPHVPDSSSVRCGRGPARLP